MLLLLLIIVIIIVIGVVIIDNSAFVHHAAPAQGHVTADTELLSCLDDTCTLTPMHAAIDYGHMDALRMLLKLGADVQAVAGGRTAVQLAFATDEFADAQQVFVAEAVQVLY